jgi:hypothetical protein
MGPVGDIEPYGITAINVIAIVQQSARGVIPRA